MVDTGANSEHWRHRLLFASKTGLVALIGFNGWVCSNTIKAIERFGSLFGSESRAETVLMGAILAFTAVAVLAELMGWKKDEEWKDLSFATPMLAALLSTFLAFVAIADNGRTAGRVLPLFVLGYSACASYILCLARRDTWQEKFFRWGVSYTFSLPLAVASAILVGVPHLLLARLTKIDNKDLVFNPPVIAALLILPHALVHHGKPPHPKAWVTRFLTLLIHFGYLILLSALAPAVMGEVHWMRAISGAWMLKSTLAFFYVGSIFLALARLKLGAPVAGSSGLLWNIGWRAGTLGLLTGFLGLGLAMCAARLGNQAFSWKLPIHHLWVGFGIGVAIPLWSWIYRDTVLPVLPMQKDSSAIGVDGPTGSN